MHLLSRVRFVDAAEQLPFCKAYILREYRAIFNVGPSMPPLGIAALIAAFAALDLVFWSIGANLQTPQGTASLGVLLGQIAVLMLWILPRSSSKQAQPLALAKGCLLLVVVLVMAGLVSVNDPRYSWPHVTAMLGIYAISMLLLRMFLVREYWDRLHFGRFQFRLADVAGWTTLFAVWLAWSRVALADEAIWHTMSFSISAGLAGLGWTSILESSSQQGRALYHGAAGLAGSTLLLQSLILSDHRLLTAAITQAFTLVAGVAIVRVYQPKVTVERPTAREIRPVL